LIKIRNVYKRFGTQEVLRGVSLDIEEGKTTAILGPSGTGKSVLLKLITGLMLVDSGEITIGDQSMTSAKNPHERRLICQRMGVFHELSFFTIRWGGVI